MINLNNKAIGPVISIILLMLVSTTTIFLLDDTIQLYKDNLELLKHSKTIDRDFEISKVIGTSIFLNNNFKNNLKINYIKIGNRVCVNPKNITINKGYIVVDIGGCTLNLGQVAIDVSVYTDYGVKSEYEILRDSLTSSLIVVSQMGPCDISSGYVGLFSLTDFNNSHAGTYLSSTYNICIRHLDYTLGTSSSGNYVNLFYLTDFNNVLTTLSAEGFDNSTINVKLTEFNKQYIGSYFVIY